MKLKISLLFILFISFYLNKIKNIKSKKYITIIFSDNKGRPSHNFIHKGISGFRHNQIFYLEPLINIALFLNRQIIFPPPWISLSRNHNKNKVINNNWDTYFDTHKIRNLDSNPALKYSQNGDIITHLNISYCNSADFVIKKKNVDIIALVNYNNKESNRYIFSSIYPKYNLKNIPFYSFLIYKYFIKFFNPRINYLPTSTLLKNYSKQIISDLNLNNYAFIHIRRGDFLNNKKLAPPDGTAPYTKPEFIYQFIIKKIKKKNIVIATNEQSLDYIDQIKQKLHFKNLFFEEQLFKNLPSKIINDNYCLYLILDQIACQAKVNIGTVGYVRLGKKYHYRLSNFKHLLN